MNLYTRKGDVKGLLEKALSDYKAGGMNAFLITFYANLLEHKVKFPLLEFCAETIYEKFPQSAVVPLCDALCKRKTEGGNVIMGKLMQLHALNEYDQALAKTTAYIADADAWYVSDIIGERVYGHHLLTDFEKTFGVYRQLEYHPSKWVVRALGAGGHYAVKKGLGVAEVETLFKWILNRSKTNEKEIKQGIGWAAKTCAKFHPEIVARYSVDIEDTERTPQWLRRKIAIGLNRNAYAKGKRG